MIKVRASAYGNLTILVTNVANHDDTVCRNIQREVTVVIGNCTRLGTLHLDSGTDERFTVMVNNLAADLQGLLGH